MFLLRYNIKVILHKPLYYRCLVYGSWLRKDFAY